MSIDSRLAKLKQEVRGVILSCPRGLTLNQFLKDYKDSIGTPFPYQEFGYDSIPSLLRDIPDVVRLNPGYGGSPCTLVPVVTNKVNHMNAMVSRQKLAPSKFQARQVPRKSIHKEPDSKGIRKPVQLPFEKKSYNQAEKENGYNGYSDNDRESCFNNNDEERSRERKSCPNESVKIQYPSLNCVDEFQNGNSRKSDVHNINYSDSSEEHCQDRAKLMGNVKEFFEKLEEIRKFTDVEENKNDYIDQSEFKPKNDYYNSDSEEDFERPPTPGVTIINEKMKNNFRELLADSYPDGIPSSKFCKQYNVKFGVPLKFEDYGFKSFQEMVANLTDVFSFQRKKNSQQWILFDTQQPLPHSDDKWVPHDVIQKVTKVVQLYPNGLNKNEIKCIYKDSFGLELDAKKYGLKSLEDLLKRCNLTETVEIIGEESIVRYSKHQHSANNGVDLQYPLPPPSEMFHLLGNKFAEDECDSSKAYQPFDINSKEKLKFAKVLACDVISPDNIWLQLDDHLDDLSKLMFTLNQYYNEFEEKHVISDYSCAVIGLICAVRFDVDNRWHRAQILAHYDLTKTALVRYVDFGTENIVSLSSIRKLKRSFWDFPIQAIQASLYGISPKPEDCSKTVGLEWSDASLNFTYELCFEKKFSVEVVTIDDKTSKLQVILLDANNSLNVNDQLIAAGHAVSIVNQRDHLIEERMSETIEPACDVNYPFMHQDFLTPGERRIRTPPGYSSRTTLSSPTHFSSTTTCERISILMDEMVRMQKRVDELQEGIKKRMLERDVLERLVCQHSHPTPEGFDSVVKFYQIPEQSVKEGTVASENYGQQHSPPALNVSKPCTPAFISEPVATLHHAQPQSFTNMHNMMGNLNQAQTGPDSGYNFFRTNNHQTPQVVHHQQPIPPHQQTPPPFTNYPNHQQHMPPNLIPKKMVEQKVMVPNQHFVPPYPPYHQQHNVMFPSHNINQWRPSWNVVPPPGLYHPYQPKVFPPMNTVQPSYQGPLVDSKNSAAEASPEVLNFVPELPLEPELPPSDEHELTPTAPPQHEVEECEVDEQPIEELNPVEEELVEERGEKEVEEYLSSTPSSTPSHCYDTSYLSEKQVRKLERDDTICVVPPPSNNWSDLMVIKKDSDLTSSSLSTATPEETEYSNQTLVDILKEDQFKEDIKKADTTQESDVTLYENREVTNFVMQISVKNIWSQSSHILLVLVEDSVAMLLKQLYMNFWCGEHDDESYNNLRLELRNEFLVFSIHYSENKHLFDKLREKNAIEEDDVYVYFVSLNNVCSALDVICPSVEQDLTWAKEMFDDLSREVLPIDEFWYRTEGY